MSDSHSNQHSTFLSVGSNIEPEANVEQAARILASEHRLIDRSRFMQTAPDGYQDQPDFLNGAFFIDTTLEFDEFNLYLKELEKRLGRVKGPIKSGPRTIDLDIIIWDGRIMHADYPAKDYTREPIDELLRKHKITINPEEVPGK